MKSSVFDAFSLLYCHIACVKYEAGESNVIAHIKKSTRMREGILLFKNANINFKVIFEIEYIYVYGKIFYISSL